MLGPLIVANFFPLHLYILSYNFKNQKIKFLKLGQCKIMVTARYRDIIDDVNFMKKKKIIL